MPKATKAARGRRTAVGETRAASDFYAGRYAKVARENFDDRSIAVPHEDVAFAVGALTFLGRVEDAATCYETWRSETADQDARTTCASRFFLGLGYARAGDFERSWSWLAANARERMRVDDPWARAFVFQGLACHRYFTGRYRSAARHALRAFRAAHAARFAYAQMLSTDLRGHALVQVGQFYAGTALLEQAKGLATRLGFGMNAFAVECSVAIYTAKFKIGGDALAGLEALLSKKSHDSYSRRMLLTQAAVQYALRGRGSDARAALEQADRDALKLDARRAKVTSLISRLYVTRFSEGPRACAELIDQAALMTELGDVAFRAELLAFQRYVGRALGDRPRAEKALHDLRAFRERAEHHVVDAALAPYEPDRNPAFAEDELTPFLRAAAAHDDRALGRMLALGVLGPIPEVLGLVPSKRVILLSSENTVLIEDRGDVWARTSPPRWLAPLLDVLGRGDASKEEIVARLWGLRRYVPDRHDSLVRTTIHRLRAFLEPRGDWVTVTARGYGLRVPVHAVGSSAAHDHHETLAPDDDVAEVGLAATARAPAVRALASADRSVLEHLVRVGVGSVPEIAQSVGLSDSTVLRALRRLVRSRQVKKRGSARATRYRAR